MSEPATIAAILTKARERLAEAGVETPELDARLLVASTLGMDSAALFLAMREPVPMTALPLIGERLARREKGEPVHRILGRRSFYAHDFLLSPATLEPRPDTEMLVELCRAPITECIARTGRCLFADIGTGTGAIAVSLLALFPEARALAVDISTEALETATRNAEAAGVRDRFQPLAGDHLRPIETAVDLIVSNPPYIPSADIAALSREVREHDPLLALDGGEDGLRSYRAIAGDARRVLTPRGVVAVEIGIGQGEDVSAIFEDERFVLEERAVDFGGVERALRFRLAG